MRHSGFLDIYVAARAHRRTLGYAYRSVNVAVALASDSCKDERRRAQGKVVDGKLIQGLWDEEAGRKRQRTKKPL